MTTGEAHSTRIRLAALLGAIAVAAGAFGAHALNGRVTEARLDTWETAARYQLIHAVLLYLLATTPRVLSYRLITAGVLVFSGSLYALVLLDLPWLGAITPFGGVCLILGWLTLTRAPRPESA